MAPPQANLATDPLIGRYLVCSKKIIALIDSLERKGQSLSDARKMPGFYRAAAVRELMHDKQLLSLVIGTAGAHVRNDLFFGIYQDSCRVMDRHAAQLQATHIMAATDGPGEHSDEVFIVNIYRVNGFQSLCNTPGEAVNVLEIKHADDSFRALGYSMLAVLTQT